MRKPKARPLRATVVVTKPITIETIKWQSKVDSDDYEAVSVGVDYSFCDADGNTTSRPLVFGVDQALTIPNSLLEKFIALGTSTEVAAALNELSDDPEQDPVVLESGVLAELLQYGITPAETWTFLLNYGAAERTSIYIRDPERPERHFVRRSNPHVTQAWKQSRVKKCD